jgi:anti-sigma-K factor RskA
VTEADDILAAEYALGLLSPEEAAAAEARMKVDAPLSLRVAWWRDQLSPLAVEAEAEPGSHVWRGIETRLGVNDNAPDAARPWKWATGGMGAVAAALLAVIALRPDPVPVMIPAPVIAAPMVASLSGERGAAVAVAFDKANSRIVITPVKLDPGIGDAELWVIPVGQTTPVSLGIIDAHAARSHNVDARYVALLTSDATFAISLEAKGGSPTGAPQGPVVASGKLIRI